ncbi:MAG TPA: ABC transporter permease [Ktedonobacterales bacterium]|nr:ABC transporter permease [Ktedonobacterales bacterium]
MSSSITALSTLHMQQRMTQRPHPLLAVLAWELRRFAASRVFWLQALGLFCFLVLLTWAQATLDQYSKRIVSAFIPGTSAWGLLVTLPPMLMLLVVLLPFVTADGVARDRQRHMRGLVMSTVVPSWAYVWGRYLIGLLMSLGLAVLLLAAILGVGMVLHLTDSGYPAPEPGTVLVLWGGMVVPATVLVASVSFALVTLFPRLSTAVKLVILVSWVVGAMVLPILIYLPSGPNALPTGYSAWDPTSELTALAMLQRYQPNVDPQSAAAMSTAQFQSLINTIANKAPDVSTWLTPHLIEAGLSLLLVAAAAFGFQRFRHTFGA